MELFEYSLRPGRVAFGEALKNLFYALHPSSKAVVDIFSVDG